MQLYGIVSNAQMHQDVETCENHLGPQSLWLIVFAAVVVLRIGVAISLSVCSS